MVTRIRISLLLFFLLGAGWTGTGCSPPPEEQRVKQVVTDYFEGRGFRVTEMRMGKIDRNALRDRDYMAPLTFIVALDVVRLEAMGEIQGTNPVHKGQVLTFRDATLHLRRSQTGTRDWEVGGISGIDIL